MLVGNHIPLNWKDYMGERNRLAKEVAAVNTLIECFQNRLFELDSLTVKGTFIKDKRGNITPPINVKITDSGINHNLSRMFKNWVVENVELQNMMSWFNSEFSQKGKSTYAFRRNEQNDVMVWLYDYLADFSVVDNHQRACFLIGKILSRYDFIPSDKHYKQKVEKNGTFKSYHDYLSNHMRMIVNRILKARERTSRFKK